MEGGEGLGELGEVPGGEGRVLGQEVFHLAGGGWLPGRSRRCPGPRPDGGSGLGPGGGNLAGQGWRGLTEWPDLVPLAAAPGKPGSGRRVELYPGATVLVCADPGAGRI